MQAKQRKTKSALFGVFAAVLILLFAVPGLAQDDGPMRLSEVHRMIRGDQTPAEVVTAAAERGIGFELSRSTLRRLDQWGFTEAQVEQLRRIAAGEDPGEGTMPEEGGEGAAEVGGEQEEFAVGYREQEGTHEAEKRRIERAIEAAALGYERIELGRVTLYCSARRARSLSQVLSQTEHAVIERFPESITNAIDPRSAHIVVVDGDSEWRNWLAAMQESYAQDGITFPENAEGDFKARMADSRGYTIGVLAAVRGDLAESEQQLHRQVTYHLGHLMMHGASRPDGFFNEAAHDALVTGFGDLVETMAMGSPSVMVYSYTERDLNNDTSWAQMVRNRFSEGNITTVSEAWTYSTDAMQPEHYAEAWSMVSLLSEAPEKLAAAVLSVQREEHSMVEAVRAAYEIEDARLLQGWQRYAGG